MNTYNEWKFDQLFENEDVDEVGMRLFWDAMRRMSGGTMNVDTELASNTQLRSVVQSAQELHNNPMEIIAAIAMAAAHQLGKSDDTDSLGMNFSADAARNAFSDDGANSERRIKTRNYAPFKDKESGDKYFNSQPGF